MDFKKMFLCLKEATDEEISALADYIESLVFVPNDRGEGDA